ncbi:hypothetical protein [Streptomyces sp. URMC 123]|uniref:hypothetical protein n=1 Tax=Streptomyces sp. URMC 123 TaxID=3423403 RepID=UPI003F1C7A46
MSALSARRRAARIALASAAVAGVVLGPAATAFAADGAAASAASAASTATTTETRPTVGAESTPAAPKPEESKRAESKPAESKPAETKPVESKPATPKATESKPATPTAVESKPATPKGGGAVGKKECTVTVERPGGAGTVAVLSNGPQGPRANFKDAGNGEPFGPVLDRKHPQAPASAGFHARIIDPYGASPKLETNFEGGGHPAGVTPFPAAPKGCATGAGAGAKGKGAKPAKPAAAPVVSGGQTKVTPKGGVAAGAEGVAGREDDTLVTAGGAAASFAAAGLGFVVLRRRRAAGTHGDA